MPYYRELRDGNKILVSKMLMLTKADAIWAAETLNASEDGFRYEAKPNFLGYEGADYGVFKYRKFSFKDESSNKFIAAVDRSELLKLCKDRPIVHQSKSWDV